MARPPREPDRPDGDPYWIIREKGGKYGRGTLEQHEAISPAHAVSVFVAAEAPKWAKYFDMTAIEWEAELVTLSIVGGQPVVTPVSPKGDA